jgi:hypothetical protein
MKFNVGDIIRSKNNMTITELNHNDEEVDEGQYFVIVSYGERLNGEHMEESGHTILCQKSGSYSFWDEVEAPLNESFSKG